ncbi:helix-turn-helix domain-containing protein [Sinomonas halotolerans]|uniref:Helix-turn-helix domain-containing protein n=1 Tax=Sinomonas halotolerans TaxID=1644133 RepID=A0ABU9WZT6_9MICC
MGSHGDEQDWDAAAASGHEYEGEPVEALLGVWHGASPAAREAFLAAAAHHADDRLDPGTWGEAPTEEAESSAALSQLSRDFNRREEALQSALTVTQAAKLIGISVQSLRERVEAGDLLGLKAGREWRLPPWQFSAETEKGYLPGLRRVRSEFPAGLVSLCLWAVRPNPDLGGSTPSQQLEAGHVEPVVRAARSITSAAW